LPRYLLYPVAVASNYIWVALHSLEHLWAGTGFTNGPSPTLVFKILNNIIRKTVSKGIMGPQVVYYEKTEWIGWHCDWCNCILMGKYPRYHVYDSPRMRHPIALICAECYVKGFNGEGMI